MPITDEEIEEYKKNLNEACQKVGITALDENGRLRDWHDLLQDIGDIWDELE